MDLRYQAQGSNKTRLRLISKVMGASAEISVQSENNNVFRIWCEDSPPPPQYQIWWQNTGLSFIDEMVVQAKKLLSQHNDVKYIVMEHVGGQNIGVNWCVVVSKENVVRTFQSEVDVCNYLRELAARYDSI